MSENLSVSSAIANQKLSPAQIFRDKIHRLSFFTEFVNLPKYELREVFYSLGQGRELTQKQLTYLRNLDTVNSQLTVDTVESELSSLLGQARTAEEQMRPGLISSYRLGQMGQSRVPLEIIHNWTGKRDYSRVARYFLFSAIRMEGLTRVDWGETYLQKPDKFSEMEIMQDAIWTVPDDNAKLHPHPQLLLNALLVRAAIFAKAIGTKK